MFDSLDVGGASYDAFAEKETGSKRLIVARRAHDHRKRLAFEPNFERRFNGDAVDDIDAVDTVAIVYGGARRPLVDADDIEAVEPVERVWGTIAVSH